jgi:excisionase family DNA binding protein
LQLVRTVSTHWFAKTQSFKKASYTGSPFLFCFEVKMKKTVSKVPDLSEEKFSVRQAAKRLGVSEKTLYRFVSENRIRHFRVGSRITFSASHLRDFLQSCEVNEIST